MPMIRCLVCEQLFSPEHSTSLPFCSPRCKQIDLSRWLDERHSLPIERAEDPEDSHLRRDDDPDER